MSFLFDITCTYDASGKEVPLSEDHAIYLMSETAQDAAVEIFSRMTVEELSRFFFLPHPKTCIEWISRHDGSRMCVVLQEAGDAPIEGGQIVPTVNMSTVMRPKGDPDKLLYGSFFFSRALTPHPKTGKPHIPWSPALMNDQIPEHKRVHIQDQRIIFWEILIFLGLLNAPNLREAEPRDMSKINKKRKAQGKTSLANYSYIRPTAHTKEWVKAAKSEPREEMQQHWVKSHFKTYWTGPKIDEQKPLIKLLAPFQRGNPERGVRAPRYIVE